MMLAESNPFGPVSGDQIIAWCAVAWIIMTMFSKGAELLARAKGKYPIGTPDNPLHARESDRSPTWAEVAALERRVAAQEHESKQMRDDMLREFAKLREEAEKRASRLMGAVGDSARVTHERINALSDAISYVRGAMDESKAKH